jgi:hypothetical protein
MSIPMIDGNEKILIDALKEIVTLAETHASYTASRLAKEALIGYYSKEIPERMAKDLAGIMWVKSATEPSSE